MLAATHTPGPLDDLTSENWFANLLEHNEVPPVTVAKREVYRTELKETQKRAVKWMQFREENAVHGQYGGIVADDLGMGKTLTTLSLIVEGLQHDRTQRTFVIASGSVMHEWEAEERKHFDSTVSGVRLVTYHGPGRERRLPADWNVLVTTYGTARAEFFAETPWFDPTLNREVRFYVKTAKRDTNGAHVIVPSPLANSVHRIVLDEAHAIRNTQTAVFHTVCSLDAEKKWCITATPVYNSFNDLFALFRFLEAAPLNEWHAFNQSIIRGLATNPENVQRYLRKFILPLKIRRAKTTLNLPTLSESTLLVTLTESERLFYNSLFLYSRDTVDRLLERERWLRTTGWGRLHTSNIGARARQCVLSTILRMRQACVHPQMAISAAKTWSVMDSDFEGSSAENDEQMLRDAAARLTELMEQRNTGDSNEECSVCLSDIPNHALIPCGHVLCAMCAETLMSLRERASCPLCRRVIQAHKPIHEALTDDFVERDDEPPADNTLVMERKWDPVSSKIGAILDDLDVRTARDPSTKALVFSQWRGGLDCVGEALTALNTPFLRIDGKVTSMKKRAEFQKRFNEDPSIKLMLCSMNCSSEGVNLQGANVVYILDPWWNEAREKQAGNRAHRLGQFRDVHIVHVIADNTIEKRVVALQKRKAIAAACTNGTGSLPSRWEDRVRSLFADDTDDDEVIPVDGDEVHALLDNIINVDA